MVHQLQLQLQRPNWKRLFRAPKGHPTFLTAILGLRLVAVFGLIARFGINRATYAAQPVLWNATLVLLVVYFFYLLFLAGLKLWMPARFHARACQTIQIGVDLIVVSLFYFFTLDMESDVFLLYYFPLMVTAEYFSLRINVFVFSLTALSVWLLLAIQAQVFGLLPLAWELKVWLPRIVFFGSVHLAYLVHRRLQTPNDEDVASERAALLQVVDSLGDAHRSERLLSHLTSYTRKVERTNELLADEWRRKNELVTRQLRTIFETSQAAIAGDDQAIDRLMGLLGEALGCQAGSLRLLGINPAGQPSLVLRAAFGHYAYQYSEKAKYLALDQPSAVIQALQRRETLIVPDIQAPGPLGVSGQVHFMDFARSYNLHAMICVPLYHGPKALGTLAFYRDSNRQFETEEINFLETLANYLMLWLENRQHFQTAVAQAQERERWLECLYELSDQLTGYSTLDQMLTFVASTTRTQLKSEVASVFLLENGRLQRKKNYPLPDLWFSEESYAVGEGLTGQAALSSSDKPGSIKHVGDVDQNPDTVSANLRHYALQSPHGTVRHLLAVPLISQRKCFGVLRLLNKLEAGGRLAPAGFSTSDANLLYTIGCQVGVAIENMRLIERVSQKAQLAEESARDLTLLHDSSQTINAQLNSRATLEATCREARRLFEVDHVALVLFDHQRQMGQVVAEDPNQGNLDIRIPLNNDFERQLIETGEPVYIPQIPSADVLEPIASIFQRVGLSSTLLVPFRGSDGQVLGSFSLDGIQRAHPMSAAQMMLVRTFARQVPLAIQNAQLFENALEQRGRLRSFVTIISDELVKHTDLAGLYALAVHSGAQLLDAEDCSLFILDSATSLLHYKEASALPVMQLSVEGRQVSAEPKAGLTSYVAATGESLRFVGKTYQQHPAWSGAYQDHLKYLESAECRSLLLVPMRADKNRVVGVLKVENRRGANSLTGFSSFDQELLYLLAAQVAKNIERMQQFERLAREAAQRERERLQGELHDTLNVFHSAIMLEAEFAQTQLKKGKTDDTEASLGRLWRASRYTYGELSNIMQDLRDPILWQQGLADALNHYAALVGQNLITVYAEFTDRLPFDIEYALFRIAQGAVSNAIRHAGLHTLSDGHVQLHLFVDSGRLYLLIRDNGQGFEEEMKRHSLGLTRMYDLARSIGTQTEINSILGVGTEVQVSVPLPEATHA